MTNIEKLKAAHSHAVLLAAKYGEEQPEFVSIFQRLDEELESLQHKETALEKARRLAKQAKPTD